MFARLSSTIISRSIRFASSSAGAEPKLFAAICLERSPVITKPDPEWLTQYEELRAQQAQKYGKHYPKDFWGDAPARASLAPDVRNWTPMPRETPFDASGDKHTMRRKLDRRLYLLVKSTGTSPSWQFPSIEHKEGETMRETAERAFSVTVKPRAEQFEVFFVGNVPLGVWKDQDSEKQLLSKTFFFKADWLYGAFDLAKSSVSDYAWVTKEEAEELVGQEKGKYLGQMLWS